MSAREWVPGDVALRVSEISGRHIALRVHGCPGATLGHLEHWHFVVPNIEATQCGNDGAGTAEYRPLVVIDPEDREQVERFVSAYFKAFWALPGAGRVISTSAARDIPEPEHVEAAITAFRSLIEPPRPPEPMGLGAVVESHAGNFYIRHGNGPAAWMLAGASPSNRDTYPYGQLDAVRVLSEGVTA